MLYNNKIVQSYSSYNIPTVFKGYRNLSKEIYCQWNMLVLVILILCDLRLFAH